MKKPNVLWIQTDEHRPDSLGCYGSSWAKTPNIDALAQRGILYQNCVCNSPVCVPSRASQLTARYPQEVNVLANQVSDEHHVNDVANVYPPGTITFPEVFEKAGYATASFGKWHVPVHRTWQVNKSLVNLDEYSGYYALNAAYDESEHHVIKRPGGTPIILAGTYPVSEGYPSQVITDWAIDWLRSLDQDQPFLLRVSHNWPHTPVLAPPPFDKLYDPADLPIRYFDEKAYQTRAVRDRRNADRQRMRELTREQIQQIWKDYMGLIACVDHETGRMIEALEKMGVLNNTIVLFSADHGKALGEWGTTEKGFYDSEVWRVPFILAGPGVTAKGKVDREICELIDTGRTLLSLADLEIPEVFEGRDLLNEPSREAVYGQIGWPDQNAPIVQRFREKSWRAPTHTAMRSAIRTQRYRMDVTLYQDGDQVSIDRADGNIFDLELDPYETRNLWNDSRYTDMKLALWEKLLNWDARMERTPQVFTQAVNTR
jgi:choline-sulfatase